MLERFNADVVYSEAGDGCVVVGRMSVVFLLHQRQPFRSEVPCRYKGDNWIGRRSD